MSVLFPADAKKSKSGVFVAEFTQVNVATKAKRIIYRIATTPNPVERETKSCHIDKVFVCVSFEVTLDMRSLGRVGWRCCRTPLPSGVSARCHFVWPLGPSIHCISRYPWNSLHDADVDRCVCVCVYVSTQATNDFLVTIGTQHRPVIHNVWAIVNLHLNEEFVAKFHRMLRREQRRRTADTTIRTGKQTGRIRSFAFFFFQSGCFTAHPKTPLLPSSKTALISVSLRVLPMAKAPTLRRALTTRATTPIPSPMSGCTSLCLWPRC